MAHHAATRKSKAMEMRDTVAPSNTSTDEYLPPHQYEDIKPALPNRRKLGINCPTISCFASILVITLMVMIAILVIVLTSGTLSDCKGMTPQQKFYQVSARGTCMGLCVAEHLADDNFLTDIRTCKSSVQKFLSKFGEKDDLYGDRTDICQLVQNIADCMATAIGENCGTNLIYDIRDFISAHIGCGNPTGPSLLTCVANLVLVKEIGSKGLSHKCIAKAVTSPVVNQLKYMIPSLPDSPVHVNVGFIKSVMKTLRGNRKDICELAKELKKCFIDDMADNGKDYCNEERIKLLEGEVNGILGMMGCPDDNYFDVMKCGLNGDLWVDQVLQGCDLKSHVNSLVGFLQLNPTIFLKNMCELHEPLDCIGNSIKASCGKNWTYDIYKGVVKPLQQYMDYKVQCKGRNHPSVIPSCQCKKNGSMFSPCPDPPFPRCSGGWHALPSPAFYGLVAYLVLLVTTWTRHL